MLILIYKVNFVSKHIKACCTNHIAHEFYNLELEDDDGRFDYSSNYINVLLRAADIGRKTC